MLRECRISGLRELLRKSSERDQQIELRALQRILGDGRLRLDVTRLPLRVKHFDVGGCAFTKRNIGDLHDLVRTVGGELRPAPDGTHRAGHYGISADTLMPKWQQ